MREKGKCTFDSDVDRFTLRCAIVLLQLFESEGGILRRREIGARSRHDVAGHCRHSLRVSRGIVIERCGMCVSDGTGRGQVDFYESICGSSASPVRASAVG